MSVNACWIWTDNTTPNPKNRFTYFRKTVHLESVPEDATLRFAADSNARLCINGTWVRRKVARYREELVHAEVIEAGPLLRPGRNDVLVLHHNWGEIVTFQRTGNVHAGLYLRSGWVSTDETWEWAVAPQFRAHEQQITGIAGDAPRIRYPMVIDGRAFDGASFDQLTWAKATRVTGGPWPGILPDVETPGQREYPAPVMGVVNAGQLEDPTPPVEQPIDMADAMREVTVTPDPAAKARAKGLVAGRPVTISGKAGETHYVTFEFERPVHGYMYLALADAAGGVVIDSGYGEIQRRLYDGTIRLREDGWLDPTAVVGKGYADRYITRAGDQEVEFPDERTARWWALHIHFPADGSVTINGAGCIKSQYPIKPVGTFRAGDPRIDRIVELGVLHAELTMIDAYVDTPGREDGQWIEDNRPRANIGAQWFGDTKLRRFFIRTIAEGQGEDGGLHPFSPSNFPAYPAAYDWSVQWVAALWDEYLWANDTDLVRRYWPVLVKYWTHALEPLREDGLWIAPRVLADLRVPPAPEPGQSSGIVTPWMIERLRWSAQMAEAIGESRHAGQWAETAERMALAFRKYHIVAADGDRPALVANRYDPNDPDIDRGFSQAGQTIAAWTGLLTPAEARAALEYCFPAPDGTPPHDVQRWNNPTYGYRVLRALAEAGLGDRAVAHLLERYAPYLPADPRNPTPAPLQGPMGGPLPEYWISREDWNLGEGELLIPQPCDETGSHGWGAVPLLWMHDSMLGVRIAEPGGAKLSIRPVTGGLPYICGTTATPKGLVTVYVDPQQYLLEVDLPDGTQAHVTPPAELAGKRLRAEPAAGGAVPDGPGWMVSGPGKFSLRAW